MKTILITGCSGMLGSNLALFASKRYRVYGSYNKNPISIPCCELFRMDIVKKDDVADSMRRIRPDYVIHSAALTDVDYCETHKDEAKRINVTGTANISESCKKYGAKMVYISTNYVFDGKKGDYCEEDFPKPVNFYGETKLFGEKISLKVKGSLVARICPYGLGNAKVSFTSNILDTLGKGKNIKLAQDFCFSPIFTQNLSEALLEAANKDLSGIYHVGGKEPCSRFEFGNAIADVFGLDKGLIEPITFRDLTFDAKRPKDTSFNVSKAQNALKTRLLGLKDGLRLMKKTIN